MHDGQRFSMSTPDEHVVASVRVLVAGEIRLYREGIARALAHRPDLRIVGTASSHAETLRLVARERPDVLLLDLSMAASASTVHSVSAAHDGLKIVAIGVLESEQDIIACAEAGLAAYVPRDASLEDLIAAIHGALRGEVHCSPRMAATLFRRVASLAADRRQPNAMPEGLTYRETEIARLIERGLSNKEISDRLRIGLSTVKNHVHSILAKMDVRRRGEAAARLREVRPRRNSGPASSPSP